MVAPMKHPTQPTLKSLALGAALLALAACGAAPKAPTPAPAGESVPGGGLAKILADRAAPQAVITFAVFAPEPPPDRPEQAARARTSDLEQAFASPPEALADAVRRGGGTPPQLALTPMAVADLPLRVDALAEGAGPLAPALTGAQSVWLVRHKGPALPGDAHLWATAAAVAVLADGPGRVLVDLATFRVTDAAGWRAALAKPDFVADQVTVEGEQAAEGVQFVTRGLAKFALPDLEMTGVQQADARDAFKHFQAVYADVRREGPAGKTLATLGECARPPEAYDQTCKAVPAPVSR